MTRLPFSLSILLSLASSLPAQETPADHAAQMKAGLALFQESIRPALDEHCVRCHGGEKTRSDFDLTSREGLLLGGESGAVIDLAKPETSFLLALLRHEEEPEMPPKKPMLPEPLLRDITRWIELGAPYDGALVEKDDSAPTAMQVTETDRDFWSFRPLADPKIPSTKGPDWAANDLDHFVLADLEKHQLVPNPPADPRTLIRRTYLDLIGLPPTPEQLDEALGLPRAELVDKLLASPHYGERWARHWLDAARFAESHGFEQDYDRKFAYHFRDFVIKALNDDMPWDQFVRWQLAGDEIAPDDPLAMMATGFLGAGVFPTQLTEKEFESARYDELDDMAATTGSAMLGLTIGCARCHDHKFDPIPVKDYYQLVSTFATTIRSEIDLELEPEGGNEARVAWEREHAAVEKARADYETLPATRTAFDQWLRTEAQGAVARGPWSVLDLTDRSSSGGSTLTPQPDGSVLVSGKSPAQETHTFKTTTALQGIRQLRIEALTHASFPRKGPGRAGNGNFALSNLKVFASPDGDPSGRRELKIISAKATHEQNQANLSVASAFDGEPSKTGWAVDFGGIGKDQAAVFALGEAVGFEAGTLLEIELTYGNNAQHVIGRPRISVSAEADPPVAVGGGQSAAVVAARKALESGKALTEEQRGTLFSLYAGRDPEWGKLDAAVAKSLAQKPVQKKTKVQVTSEGFPPTKHHADGRGFPHFYKDTYHLQRGDPNQKGEVATQGFLQVLMRNGKSTTDWQSPPPEGARTSHRRKALAEWITDTENGAGHLLARVVVNRLWHHHFGRGIVATTNDFGLQGAEPTHPELLDFLARRLIAGGWNLKALHREILLSATWCQSSAPDPAKAAIDPENDLLWRFRPRRLEAEIVRDAMLSASGQLDTTMFGPGTLNEAQLRRSIYFMIKRSRLVPMMQIFDQPEPLASQGSRPSTTIAPQALLFMNNPQVVRWASALAAKVGAIEDPSAAVADLYLRTLGRQPSATELTNNLAFLSAQGTAYAQAGAKNARQLAIADLCQVVFGLNEFVYLN